MMEVDSSNHPPVDSKNKYSTNWIDLWNNVSTYQQKDKTYHIASVVSKIKRGQVNSSNSHNKVIKYIYLIRTKCLIIAYFGHVEPSMHRLFYPLYNKKYFNFLNMTEEERDIISKYRYTLECLEKKVDEYSCGIFTRTDELFGIYRHKRWLKNQ